MLDFSQTREFASTTRSTAVTTLIAAEGQCLVRDFTIANGVVPSTGAATVTGEQLTFAGVSLSTQIDPTNLIAFEEPVSSATSQILLAQPSYITTTAPQVFVYNVTTSTAFTYSGTPGQAAGTVPANQWSPTSAGSPTLQVPTANANQQFLVGYRYPATVAGAQWLQGDQLPGRNIANLLNQVGVLTHGDVFTDQFDVTANWQASGLLFVTTGTNGQFTVGTAANAIPGVSLLSRPTFGNPWLGISIGSNG
jgi:hypothetical protein